MLVETVKQYTRKATPKGKTLGSGTFGSVIEMESSGETLAGKIFRFSSCAQLKSNANKICGEVILMLQLQHSNIVQCKGVSLLADEPLPVLLMERLMSSLCAYLLDPEHSNLPVQRKVSMLLDTAQGLNYLHNHTPAIIHRDLTAKNVLLDSTLTAKITDFGNSRMMDLNNLDDELAGLTGIPGTLEYMPPEAQGGTALYGPSLDIFSFGHLSLFTITQKKLRLLPPSTTNSRGKIHSISEVKRRESFIKTAEELLTENCMHPLL